MLRIISNGYPNGTKVVDEHGKELEQVTSIRWEIDKDRLAVAVIEVVGVPLTISAEQVVVEFTCPFCYDSTRHECKP